MDQLQPKDLARARDILIRYYRALVGRFVDDVIEKEEVFDPQSRGRAADDLLEMHNMKLGHVTTAITHLENWLRAVPNPEKKTPSAPDKGAAPSKPVAAAMPLPPSPSQPFCPDCRGPLPTSEEKCLRCGWTPG